MNRSADTSLLPPHHGELPPWSVADLPAPPPFGARNMLRVIGPGAIMAATSIGGGEWLVGPAAAVKYSSAIFLIATVAIALQVVFNLEAIRYTVYSCRRQCGPPGGRWRCSRVRRSTRFLRFSSCGT